MPVAPTNTFYGNERQSVIRSACLERWPPSCPKLPCPATATVYMQQHTASKQTTLARVTDEIRNVQFTPAGARYSAEITSRLQHEMILRLICGN